MSGSAMSPLAKTTLPVDRVQAALVARVGQGVEHRDLHVGTLADGLVDEVGADEAGSAGDEHVHARQPPEGGINPRA